MAEPRVIRLLRTAIGMILGFLLMGAAVAVAYQGLLYGQRILGITVLVVVGSALEVCTHVIGIKTRGLGRGIMIGIFAAMIVAGRLIVQSGGGLGMALAVPLFVFFIALFVAWLRERLSPAKET